ncbi:putative potassium transporter [Helianthus annuus]|nr:putative potassium transporter [Helianthus annuus]KAJ0630047.1 putative potassium transporter [Helianthus annuus]
MTQLLAYQSFGVVYGDLSTTPLYVYRSTFAEDIQHSQTNEEIFGVLSFVFWTLTLVPLCKYVFIVMRDGDNDEGNYLLPNRHVPTYWLLMKSTSWSNFPIGNNSKFRMLLEKYKFLHTTLLILVLPGTCMVIGDGVLTPVISESLRWPVLAIAILASVVRSQVIISRAFSIINQSQSLGYFLRVKVVHTSDKIHGQIYILEINGILMILCIAITICFRDIKHMGNASGFAEMAVMLVTTCLASLAIVLCWHKPSIIALYFLLFLGSIELLYFSAGAGTKYYAGVGF